MIISKNTKRLDIYDQKQYNKNENQQKSKK